MIQCILIISCLVVGFLLGRIGSHVYDGLFVLGTRPGNHQIKLAMDDIDLPHCQYLMLKVVHEEEIESQTRQTHSVRCLQQRVRCGTQANIPAPTRKTQLVMLRAALSCIAAKPVIL